MIKNFISGCKDTAIFWNNKPFAKKKKRKMRHRVGKLS